MQDVASSVFWVVQFPFQGKIVTVDWLYLCSPDATSNTGKNVPLLMTTQYQKIGVGLIKDSSFMGIFPLSNPPLVS